MVHKEEFVSWRNQEVTQELKKELLEAIENAAMEILNRETPNLDRDQFLRGFIKGMNVAIEWVPEFFLLETQAQLDANESEEA